MVTPDEIREVLRALHAAATHRDDDGVPCEERGLAWGPPAWHEGVALWARVLAITETKLDEPPFVSAWELLLAQARRYVDMVEKGR